MYCSQDSQYFDASHSQAIRGRVTAGFSPSTANMDIVSCWVPLTDTDKQNGCLNFLPGSQRLGLLDGARDEHLNMRLDKPLLGATTAVPARVGDLILFSNLVVHGSHQNLSEVVRWSLDWRYHVSPNGRAPRDAAEAKATQWWAQRAWFSATPKQPLPNQMDWRKADPVGLEVAGTQGLDAKTQGVRAKNQAAL